jgi:hypothetical protein
MTNEYTDAMADRATRRHARRNVDGRLALLRAMLCNAAYDDDPSYQGVDPDTGREYRGPAMWRNSLDMLCYFIASRLLHASNGTWSDSDSNAILSIVRHAIDRARYHDASSRRYWNEFTESR